MKLNYKNTFLVGLAFFLICVFWQSYDTLVALTLTNKYGMSQSWSGVIMALDNVLALFMLPLFGALSDKANGRLAQRFGKRTPFILIGTIIAIVCFFCLSVVDTNQAKLMQDYSNPEIAATNLWNTNREINNPYYVKNFDSLSSTEQADRLDDIPEGFRASVTVEKGKLQDLYTLDDFNSYMLNDNNNDDKQAKQDYADVVIPVRNAYAEVITNENPTNLIVFIIILLFALFSMATFRSPAVALMPAVTIKPLRSKANGIINIMGVVGGAIILLVGMVIGTGKPANALMSYIPMVGITCIVMLIALIIFMFTVNEPSLVATMEQDTKRLGLDEEKDMIVDSQGHKKMAKNRKISFIFLMLSIALWFFGYNAITSKYAVYASQVLLVDYNTTLLIAQIAALIAFLPAGMLATRIGRKKTIMGGIILLTAAFLTASFLGAGTSVWLMNALFILAGVGWASINVNSLPMVVELATGADVGKYTGYYYTASMAAQIVTPILSGKLMDVISMREVLFPYGAIFVALSFVTMIFVKHGDSNAEQILSQTQQSTEQ
ncbi:MAG: MFS transporter [Clostridia bacterium]|nr:MFS transporter [Clostridia bacterium]MDD3832096.1 MFS transporter [Clostridia bacterium]